MEQLEKVDSTIEPLEYYRRQIFVDSQRFWWTRKKITANN